jgi:hypothetical protein
MQCPPIRIVLPHKTTFDGLFQVRLFQLFFQKTPKHSDFVHVIDLMKMKKKEQEQV